MSQSSKKKKQKQRVQERELSKIELPDQEVLDSIGSPNVWTPKGEDAWLQELRKLRAGEIYRRFPPMKKPPHVRNRGRSSGWGNSDA